MTYGITNGKIRDVGCGPGNLKTALGDSFSYTGIDVSEDMLLKAKEKGYRIIHGRVEEMLSQISDKSFDYVVSLSALHFVKDINATLVEFGRIARNGWLVSLLDITSNYIKNFPVDEPMYNHSNIILQGAQEDICFPAWTSITTGDTISERMIFKRLS